MTDPSNASTPSDASKVIPTRAAGIDTAELDPSVRAQDDLFRHVNGRWIERTTIPADKARYGSFIALREQAEAAVRHIIEALPSADSRGDAQSRKLADLYASFMDLDRIESLGGGPISGLLSQVSDIGTISDLLTTLGRLERQGVNGFLQPFVDNDPGSPERYLVFVEQSGIGLPDESYFRDEQFSEIRVAYRAHLARMFTLAEVGDSDARAERVFELESEIAACHWDNVTSRDAEKTYNLHTWASVRALIVGIGENGDAASDREKYGYDVDLADWRAGLEPPAAALDEIVVRQPSFLAGVGALMTTDRLPAWRDWLASRVIHSFAPYLSAAFVDENFDFYGRTLTGAEQLRERWKRGVALVERAMGEASGRLYVDEHFPPDAKEQMDALVANLIAAYRSSIGALEWMGSATKAQALTKLDKFTPKIGYPKTWRDYSALTIDPNDLVANVRAAAAFELDRDLAKIGQPIDRDEWLMTPQTVNAYYNPGMNEIVFPAAILQYPFFDPTRDAAANYGAIGAVIGHEIGHGFDDQGSKFDGDGRLTQWWTRDDRAAFEALTASLIDQYDALTPAQVPGHHVNGALTIGENIGDLGGLGIAWKAYLISLDGAQPPVIDQMTAAQRFFLSWAQAWQQKGRDEETIRLLAIDPHAPNEFRCNQIVRNLDLFYEAFDVTESDEMFLDPASRVAIW